MNNLCILLICLKLLNNDYKLSDIILTFNKDKRKKLKEQYHTKCYKIPDILKSNTRFITLIKKDHINYNNTKFVKILGMKQTGKQKNKGEKGEINIIKYLFSIKENIQLINKIFGIKSIIKLIDPSNKQEIININMIKKSSYKYKADIIIKFININKTYNISIKCGDGAPPTLLNHTNRTAKCFHDNLIKYLPTLDEIIKDLNSKRKSGIYKEDILYKNMVLSEEQKDVLINVIKYFTFEGTGSCLSSCPADSILFVKNSTNVIGSGSFIDCKKENDKKKYIIDILPIIRISIRSSKGMPDKETTKNYDQIIKECQPWIYKHIDKKARIKLCGALHIRYI